MRSLSLQRPNKPPAGGEQLDLFQQAAMCIPKGRVLKQVSLRAESPREAIYVIALVSIQDGFLITKASGSKMARPIKEAWYRETEPEAIQKFESIIQSKTDPNRKSKRLYKICGETK